MQQKQSKSETATKKGNSFGKMMLQKDKNRFQMKEQQAYIELLKAPRGKEYLRLLGKTRGIAKQLAEMDEEIKRLQQEIEREAEMLPADVLSTESIPEEKRTEEDKPEQESVPWMTGASKLGTSPAWMTDASKKSTAAWADTKIDAAGVMQSYEEKKQKLLQLQAEQSRLVEEFQKEQKAFIEQLPAPDRLIGWLWPDWSTDILLRYGVIPCPGTVWKSQEELLEQVQPRTEQEERQWIKGSDVYLKHYCDELLVVEVYMEAVCVVFMDGSTTVIE